MCIMKKLGAKVRIRPVGQFRSTKTNQMVLIVRRKNESVKDAIIRVSNKHGVDPSTVQRLI